MTLEVITPSYAPDFELCKDLAESVVRRGGDRATHTIIVPPADLPLFAELRGPRTIVVSVDDYLPGLKRLPRNFWLNPRRPFVPVRGWIAQQLVKLEAAARSSADIVLMVDSDLVFVRDFGADTFTAGDGSAHFYRWDEGVHKGMSRHITWHREARELLQAEVPIEFPIPDYICCPCPWEPSVVRRLLARIETCNGAPWQRALASRVHLSEMILYGVFLESMPGDHRVTVVDDMRCLRHYDEVALPDEVLQRFIGNRRITDIAVMISAKSGTDLLSRRQAMSRLS